MDSDDEEMDPSFFDAIDQVVVEYNQSKQQTQAAPHHFRGSQPASPCQAPPPGAATAVSRVQAVGQVQRGPLFHQHPPAPLQQLNGTAQLPAHHGHAGPQPHKPPLWHTAANTRGQPQLAARPGGVPPPGQGLPPVFPHGAAAVRQTDPHAQPAAASYSGSQPPPAAAQQQWQRPQAGAAPPPVFDAQAQQQGLPSRPASLQQLEADLAVLRSQKSSIEGQNKLLRSNLEQEQRACAGLRQRVKQLEAAAKEAGITSASTSGSGAALPAQPLPHQQAHRPGFAVGEMQRQMESLRQQLLFKEQEIEDLKRQYSERTDQLKQMEASRAELRSQLQAAATAAAAAATGSMGPAAGGGGSEAAAQEQPDRRRSSGQASGASVAARNSGQKRRQSGGGSLGAAAAPAASPAAAVAKAAAVAGALPTPPLLDRAVLAAASSLTSSSSLVSQLLAACSSSMALLVGAPSSGEGRGAAQPPVAVSVAAPTALLLRKQLAAAAAAPDTDSLQFVSEFSRHVQQVACGMLPPAALLDSIACLVAGSLAQVPSSPAPASNLPAQRVQLIAAGLQVATHLLALDSGCRQAALAPPDSSSSGGGSNGRSAGSSSWQLAAPPGLSGRVQLSCPAGPHAAASAAAAIPAFCTVQTSSMPGAAAGYAGLQRTAQVVQQQPALFAGLDTSNGDSGNSAGSSGGVLLPVSLSAALWLGQQHEAVAAGALGVVLELARALQGPGARAVLAPVFTSGAMELFMQPQALRLQALHLLHLLLEDASLAQLFEGSLVQAAAARGEPGPPFDADGDTGGSGGREGAGGSATPGREPQSRPTEPSDPAGAGAAAGAGNGALPMQVEGVAAQGQGQEGVNGGGSGGGGGPWLGAAVIAERLLDSFVLDCGSPSSCGTSQPCSAASPTGQEAVLGGGSSGWGMGAGGVAVAVAVARAAMQLVAMLREQRQQGILLALLLDDACGAPGCMLAQRLIQLAESATAVGGEDAGLMLLCPVQWPQAVGSCGVSWSGSAGAGSSGLPQAQPLPLLQHQAGWQQRLRVAQEALTLLRGLLVDDSCRVAAMDDLVAISAVARLTLTTLSRLTRLEPPPAAPAAGRAAVAAAEGAGAAPAPGALLLAPWARAIGSSTEQASIAEAGGGAGVGGTAASGTVPGALVPGGLPVCSVEDVVYMAKSLRRRVLARIQSAMVQG